MFKTTKVNSQIRKSSRLFWYRDKHSDYICNGYWAIKINLKEEEYRKVLSALVERFGTIPDTGEALEITGKGLIGSNTVKPNWLKVVKEEPSEVLIDTNLIYSEIAGEMRVFKGEDCIHVNNKYMEMVDVEEVIIKGKGKLNPVFFCKEDEVFLVLPIRIPTVNEHLKEVEIKKDSQGLQSQKSQ